MSSLIISYLDFHETMSSDELCEYINNAEYKKYKYRELRIFTPRTYNYLDASPFNELWISNQCGMSGVYLKYTFYEFFLPFSFGGGVLDDDIRWSIYPICGKCEKYHKKNDRAFSEMCRGCDRLIKYNKYINLNRI